MEKENKEEIKEPEKETYIEKEEALEKLLQFADLNNIMIWMAATMSTIAAINSLTGPTVITKCLVFMIIGLVSLIIYKRRFKK